MLVGDSWQKVQLQDFFITQMEQLWHCRITLKMLVRSVRTLRFNCFKMLETLSLKIAMSDNNSIHVLIYFGINLSISDMPSFEVFVNTILRRRYF